MRVVGVCCVRKRCLKWAGRSFRERTVLNLQRRSMQTLLVGLGCGGVLGLLPGRDGGGPGKRSPRLGIPSLCYATPLVLEQAEMAGAFE